MKTKIIGLTGGIGSGKTTIANYFKARGVPLYIADDEAKKILYAPDTVKEIISAFGNGVITDNLPDRGKLAAEVFNAPERLKLLNSIIHPKVFKHFKVWLEEHKNEKFIIKEAAILFESGSYKDCDKIILVTAPIEMRIQRVVERDGITRDKVEERISSQWDEAKKVSMSDYIIENVVLEDAIDQADKILKILEKI